MESSKHLLHIINNKVENLLFLNWYSAKQLKVLSKDLIKKESIYLRISNTSFREKLLLLDMYKAKTNLAASLFNIF